MIYSPLVSIIIPVYNVEQYLSETLDSVLALSYHNWECICINDGSTDKSGDILEEYAQRDKRILVHHQHNAGVSAARNKGLSLMTGDYFTFFDSDDLYYPHALEHYMSYVKRHDVDMVEVSFELYRSDGQQLWSEHEAYVHTVADHISREDEPFPQHTQSKPSACNKLFRRTVWEKKPVYFKQGLKIGEDRLFTSTLSQSYRSFAQSSQKVIRYRKDRPDSAMSAAGYLNIIRDDIATYANLFQNWKAVGRWHEVREDILQLYYDVMRDRLSHLRRRDTLRIWGEMVYTFHRMFLKSRRKGEKYLYLKHASLYKRKLLHALFG